MGFTEPLTGSEMIVEDLTVVSEALGARGVFMTVQVIRSPRMGVIVAGTAKAVVAPLRALVHDMVATYWEIGRAHV